MLSKANGTGGRTHMEYGPEALFVSTEKGILK